VKEKEIENSILQYLSLIKIGYFWKNNSTGVYDPTRKIFRKTKNPYLINGVADIIGVVMGRIVMFEVKSKSGKQPPSQIEFEKNITENGGLYSVVRSIDDVRDCFISWGIKK